MILVRSNIWDSLVIIPLDAMSELCGLLLVWGLIRSLSTGQGSSRVQPCSFLSTVITPLVNLIRSQGFFFFFMPKLIYFNILNSMEFYLFLTKTVHEDEARIKPSLLFFLHLIIVNS